MKCPQCQSEEIDTDTSRGDSACMSCGFIITQNAIVSEVGFVEGANGSSSVLGQFVASTGSARLSASAKTRGPGGRGPSVGYQKDSREHTIQNGRKSIQQVADHLRLRTHHVDSAVRLFMLAVQHNFIQGRRTAHVVAACLYIVCRREKTPHLLIDFSDVLQINLYVLGATFLKFIRLLNLSLPIIDPSLYIHRFAAQLELKDDQNRDKTHIVAMTALRLVARMKRDWILIGRRPSGICGACLLIASRIHGFKRTQKEIIYIVKICDMTLRKRLTEFSNTQSSQLTLEEFETMDVDLIQNSKAMVAQENAALLARDPNAQLRADPFGIEQDPPAFTRNRVAEKEAAAIRQHKLIMQKDKEELLKDLEFDTVAPAKQALLTAGSAPPQSNLAPPQLLLTAPAASSAAAAASSSSSSAEDARDLEIQAIQTESRRLIESNTQVSDSIVAQLEDLIDGKQSEFAQLDEGPQRQVDTGLHDTHVHVTPLGAPLHDSDSAAAAAASSSASSAAGASSAAVPAPPGKERLKSIHKAGPNLSHSRVRPSRGQSSILMTKDAAPNDLTGVFPVPAATTPAEEVIRFHNAGDPMSDALVVASDPSFLALASDAAAAAAASSLSVPVNPNLDTWTDLDEFDAEISESILLTEDEAQFKIKAWEAINKDYLLAQEEKRQLAANAGAANLGPDGQPLPRRAYKKKPKHAGPASNAAEATMRLLAEKRYSDKINYNALQGLLAKLDDDGPAKPKKGAKAADDDDEDDDDDAEDDAEEADDADEEEQKSASKKRGNSALSDQLPSAKRRVQSITGRHLDDVDEAGEDDDNDDAPMTRKRQLSEASAMADDDDDDGAGDGGGDPEDY